MSAAEQRYIEAEGERCCWDGVPRSRCPYSQGPARQHWLQGWDSAKPIRDQWEQSE